MNDVRTIRLVIPMYNESEIIEATMRACESWFCANAPDGAVYFVDDGSTDDTARKASALLGQCPHARLTGYEHNRGKGAAVRFGMLAAAGDADGGDVIFFTDCDLAYGLDVMLDFMPLGGDVAIGSRALHPDGYRGYTALRRVMSKTYLAVIRVAAGFPYSDSQTGIKAFTPDAARKIFGVCEVDGFAFDLEVLMAARHMGMSVAQVPVRVINNRPSHVSVVRDTLRMLRTVRTLRRKYR
ncbi:MAG: glycosyltransferase [Eubacteriales bacterium]